jgi:squalene-hopene/tetraprenyl-beta-curcumene cyclase
MLRTALGCVFVAFFAGVAFSADPPKEPPKNQYEFGAVGIARPTGEEPLAPLSVDKAMAYLNTASTTWNSQRKCIACHTNGTYMTMRPLLHEQLGEPDLREREFFVKVLAAKQKEAASNLQKGTTPEQIIYLAAGLAEWDRHITSRLSSETDAALRLMFKIQRPEGAWRALDCWPPYESDEYHPATVAAMAVAAAPGWLAGLDKTKDAELLKNVERLKTYLRDTPPPHDYGRVLLLWSSLRMPLLLTDAKQKELVALLASKQHDDGGWSIRNFAEPEQWGKGDRADRLRAEPDFSNPPSDGHMTGLAVVVLREAGVAKDDPRIVKAIAWLKSNQRESGRWWTRSLNTDQYHFITYSGTAFPIWALAVCDELPTAVKLGAK